MIRETTGVLAVVHVKPPTDEGRTVKLVHGSHSCSPSRQGSALHGSLTSSTHMCKGTESV